MSKARAIQVGKFTFDESYECPDPEGVRFIFPLSRSLSSEEFEGLKRDVESFQIMRRDQFEV